VLGPLVAVWAQLPGSQHDSGRGNRPQRPLLIGAEDQAGQLLAARIGEEPYQPCSKVIGDEHYPSMHSASHSARTAHSSIPG